MNRNMMYDILKEKGLYPIFRYHSHKRTYHTEFVVDNEYDCTMLFDWGYVRHISRVSLCTSEMVLQTEYSEMKVNINYKDVESLEVRIIEKG